MTESKVYDPETWMWYEAHTEKAVRDIIGNRMYEWLDRLSKDTEDDKRD